MNNIITTAQIANHLQVRISLIKEVRRFYNCYLVIFHKGNGLRPRFVTLKAVIETRQWTEADKLLINRWVSARLVNIPVNEITNTYLLKDNQVIIETGNIAHFTTIKQYWTEFVETRKLRTKDILSFPEAEGHYIAINTENEHQYQVTLTKEEQSCTCKDFENQLNAFGKGCCKHLYKTLQSLGYGSLKTYLAA